MSDICGNCEGFIQDEDYPDLMGRCPIKNKYVAFYAHCNIDRWRPKN